MHSRKNLLLLSYARAASRSIVVCYYQLVLSWLLNDVLGADRGADDRQCNR